MMPMDINWIFDIIKGDVQIRSSLLEWRFMEGLLKVQRARLLANIDNLMNGKDYSGDFTKFHD
jgi:hypothetical protein